MLRAVSMLVVICLDVEDPVTASVLPNEKNYLKMGS